MLGFLATKGVHTGNLMLKSLRFVWCVCRGFYHFGRALLALCNPKNLKALFKRNKPTP
ncbi:hypothetical protein [Helicobacter ailurogastricus]|uniref:hypothetical protein n=1 Tax=Helicobacter ailurogastricus TaxID=1578720 RepID=UPI001315AD1D|nr:hypothetical protein [Helicobacter ailurogastricus]